MLGYDIQTSWKSRITFLVYFLQAWILAFRCEVSRSLRLVIEADWSLRLSSRSLALPEILVLENTSYSSSLMTKDLLAPSGTPQIWQNSLGSGYRDYPIAPMAFHRSMSTMKFRNWSDSVAIELCCSFKRPVRASQRLRVRIPIPQRLPVLFSFFAACPLSTFFTNVTEGNNRKYVRRWVFGSRCRIYVSTTTIAS